MRTVISLLTDVVRRHPDHPYLAGKGEDGWSSVSFGEADRLTDVVGAWILGEELSRGDRIAVLAEGRPEWPIAEIGLIKAGMISVPMSIKLLKEEIPFRINHSGAVMIVVSHITLPKVLDAYGELENAPRLLLLDEPDDATVGRMEGLSLSRGTGWLTWKEMMASGKSRLEQDPAPLRASLEAITEDDTVNICYTSGTSGNPKGVMLSHLNYWSNATEAVEHFGLPDAEYETLVILPLDHSFAHTVATYSGLARAITLSFVDARQGSMGILRNIPINMTERSATFLLTVPALSGNFMKKIVDGVAEKGAFINGIFTRGIAAGAAIHGDGFKRPSLGVRLRYGFSYALAKALVFAKVKRIFGDRILFFVGGGAILERKQQEFFSALGVPVYQGYGLTESAPIISTNTPTVHKFGTCGRVLPGVTCRIMKSDTEEAAPGEKGHIVVRGDNVMKGYYRNPDATAEALRDGWLWTGDLGYFDEDGFLLVVGREKALLISPDGEKYPPETIEEAIAAHTGVFNQIMAYNDHRNFTTALVTLDTERCRELFESGGIETASAALEALEAEFRRYIDAGDAVPTAWRPTVFEVIPKEFSEEDQLVNSTMKLVRHRIAEFYSDRIEAMYHDNDVKNPRNRAAVAELFGLEDR